MDTEILDKMWNGEDEYANLIGNVINVLRPALIADIALKKDGEWLELSFRYKKL